MNSESRNPMRGQREKILVEPAPAVRPWMLALATILVAVVSIATANAQESSAFQPDPAWSGYESQPLRVNVWHDRQEDEVYERGEAVRIHFETNADAYTVVYRIDAEGEVSILWPRSRFDDGFVFGHHTYNLPAPGSKRIRVAGEEGVEYVQAIVSAYPFDLRGIEVDFHHENDAEPLNYYVAGDPFLAMNDVNYAITGLEDAEEFVATNYVSYYVHRKVDHPRYLCGQCHDDAQSYRPYSDTCVMEIHHDYGWDNDWYVSFGYYPVYRYPVYYYVDPWTWRASINYWYRPWYNWPTWGHYHWDYDCYVWNNSPHWRGDVWTRYRDGSERYRPISKDLRYRTAATGDAPNPPGMVKTPRPSSKDLAALQTKTPVGPRPESRVRGDGKAAAGFRDVPRSTRKPAEFARPESSTTRPGIRVPAGPRVGGGAVRATSPGTQAVRGQPATGGPDRPRVLSGTKTRTPDGATRAVKPRTDGGRTGGTDTKVRPVEPRSRGSRIWSGGGSSSKGSTPQVKPRSGGSSSQGESPRVKPRSSGGSSSQGSTPRVKPSGTGSTSGRGSTPTTKPRSSGSSSSQSSSQVKPRSSSGSSSKSGGSSSSGGTSRPSGGKTKSKGRG